MDITGDDGSPDINIDYSILDTDEAVNDHAPIREESTRLPKGTNTASLGNAKQQMSASDATETRSTQELEKRTSAQPAQAEDYDSDENRIVPGTTIQALRTRSSARPSHRRDAASDSGYSSSSAPLVRTSRPAARPAPRVKPVIHRVDAATSTQRRHSVSASASPWRCEDPDCRDPECLLKCSTERCHATPRSDPRSIPRTLNMNADYAFNYERAGPPPSASAYYTYRSSPAQKVSREVATHPGFFGHTGGVSASQESQRIPTLEPLRPPSPSVIRTESARPPIVRPSQREAIPIRLADQSDPITTRSTRQGSVRSRDHKSDTESESDSSSDSDDSESGEKSRPVRKYVGPGSPRRSDARGYEEAESTNNDQRVPSPQEASPLTTQFILNDAQVSRSSEVKPPTSAAERLNREIPVPTSPSQMGTNIDDPDDDSAHGWDDDSVFAESTYAESIFSQASLASSATTASIAAVPEGLIRDFVAILFCTEDLQNITAIAVKDPTIGAQRFERNFRRLIVRYGKSLNCEAVERDQFGAAKLLQSRSISTRTARDVVQQAEQSKHEQSEDEQFRHEQSKDTQATLEQHEPQRAPQAGELFSSQNNTLAMKIMAALTRVDVNDWLENDDQEDSTRETSTETLNETLQDDDDDVSEISVDDQEEISNER